MQKINSFANEYKHWIIIIVNVVLASVAIGILRGNLNDLQADRQMQNQVNISLTKNLSDVTYAVKGLTDEMKDLRIEHGELMKMHHLYPHQWQTPGTDKGEIQPFPK